MFRNLSSQVSREKTRFVVHTHRFADSQFADVLQFNITMAIDNWISS